MNLLSRLLRREPDEITRYSLDQYANDLAFAFAGNRYVLSGGSTGWTKTEDIETSFSGYINSIYKSNGVVFAIILARMLLFSEARFCWFDVADNGEDGRPAGREGLQVLERPWPNASTGELLSRMEQDVSLGGNFYAVREPNRLRRLRPDWLTIVLTAPPAEAVESDVAGYWYHPGRTYSNAGDPTPTDEVYLPDEIAHFSPIPDPDAQYRGMSWLTPVVREVMADKAATDHKLAFFENGAQLGVIISAKENLTNAQFKEWKENFSNLHSGTRNAYKSLFLASPVDTNVTTANMQQLEFKVTQGAGETRLCAAGGVPPIIVGLSEGLASATYSNYGMARRKFGDGWAHPQWKMASTALSNVVTPPNPDLRLGVNTRGIAFLREDAKDLAEIMQIQASAVSSFITAGYTPDSSAAAVDANDLSLLKHTGLFSVQLQQPGAEDANQPDAQAEAAAADEYQQALDEFRAELADDDDIVRAASDLDDDDVIERKYYDIRVPKGHEGGGRFRKLSDRIGHALNEWLSGNGDQHDPLEDFNREQLRLAAKEFGITPRRGASAEELKLALLQDARGRFHGAKAAKSPEAGKPVRFTLKGKDHRNLDVGVFTEPSGKLSLWEVSDSGERRKRVALVDDLAGLQAWADEHGEPELAGWARKERGGAEVPKAPVKKATKAAPVKALSTDPAVREIELENRIRAIFREKKSAGGWASLVAIREGMPDVDRSEMDRTLERLAVTPGVQVIPWDNTKALSQADRKAALRFGGQDNHAIRFEDPSPRPLPKAAAPDVSALRAMDTEHRRDALDLRKVEGPDGLKALLREQGLPVSGRKRDLVDRLVGHLEGGSASASVPTARPSGLPTDRKPVSGDFDDLAARLISKNEQQILDLLADLNASELARLALKYEGARKARSTLGTARGAKSGLRFPGDVTSADARRLWLAQKLVSDRKIHGAWRSVEPDGEDEIERAEETDLDETDVDDDDDPTLDQIRAMAEQDDDEVDRAAGHDVTPGHDELHHYWTRGKGRALWENSLTPWRTLYALVTAAVRKNGRAVAPEQIKRWVSRWFIEVKHYAAGSDANRVAHGHPPRGHRVGPG